MNPLLNKAAAYCAAAEHCRSEVQTKLLQWGASAGQAGDILDQLEDQGFISESRYCAAFVNDKIRFQGWGKEKIRMALKQKRLPNSLIEEAIDAFPQEEYEEQMYAIIARKAATLSDADPYLRQAKLARFLASRGFSYSDAADAISSILNL